jgi:hypothetical protein
VNFRRYDLTRNLKPMSIELLYHLNGENRGAFYDWLQSQSDAPRIAWYPSAGSDYRDLLYLSEQYATKDPAGAEEPAAPTFFIHTDHGSFFDEQAFSSAELYKDYRTTVEVKTLEELPRCVIDPACGIVDASRDDSLTGRVVFMEIEVRSRALGLIKAPVVYAFCENEGFCAKVLLPLKSKISHIVQVRYGAGMGSGGWAAGIWLWNVMERLGSEVYVGDGDRRRESGDLVAYERYPDLRGSERQVLNVEIRRLHTKGWHRPWDGFGEIRWNVAQSCQENSHAKREPEAC